jgi:hypothetical protein
MAILFGLWLVVFGMRDAFWELAIVDTATIPASGGDDVSASEGPVNPPKP